MKSLYHYYRSITVVIRSLVKLYLYHYNIYRPNYIMPDGTLVDSTCPFCNIASAFAPVSPLDIDIASVSSSMSGEDGLTPPRGKTPSSPGPVTTTTDLTKHGEVLGTPAIESAVPVQSMREDMAVSEIAANTDPFDPDKTFPPSFVVLSTPDLLAFFDIAPLTRGHILVASRRHRVKLGDLGVGEGSEVSLLGHLYVVW